MENKTLARITPKEREEKRLWNSVALREAVINAIVHNDYTSEIPPKFEFFDDRIEIISPGGLPSGITEDEYLSGKLSVLRNRNLANVFYRLGFVEIFGTGITRIKQLYEEGLKQPDFEVESGLSRGDYPNYIFFECVNYPLSICSDGRQ